MNVYNTNPCSNINTSQVGHGYRNVCWRPSYAKGGRAGIGKIDLFGYDKEGNPKTFSFPFCPSVKYEVKYATKEKDLFGRFLETKWFDNTFDRKQWCVSMEGKVRIISAYSPEQEFLMNLFRKYVFDDDYNKQKLRVHFIDIEVAIEHEFPEPELAKYPINLITVFDTDEERYISWALSTKIQNTLNTKEFPVELRKFDTEEDLLMDYLNWHSSNYPDVISGWNTREFDITYIVQRLENVFGKQEAKRYSPVGYYKMREDKKNYGKKYMTVKGISGLDLLFLYRNKFGIKQALDGGYNLNNVAMVEIEDAKLHYDGSMLDFYKKNFQKFWEYNVQDVNLVVKLEKKLGLIKIARKITSFGCSNYEEIYKTISYIISSQDIFARNRFNKTYISYISSSARGKDVDQYDGAWVFPTQKGLYKQGIAGVDVNSLYPNTAFSVNLSPETLIGTVTEKAVAIDDAELENAEKEYIINFVDGRRDTFTETELNELLETKCTITRNNVLFIKPEIKKGIFAEWCRNFFIMRKGVKKHMAQLEQKIRDLEKEGGHEIEISELKAQAEVDHATQYALKIMINSAYGTLGTTYSPIYDVRLAEAITGNGQFCNRSTSTFLNNYYKEHYNCPENFNVTISGDTDSVAGDTELEVIINEDMFKKLESKIS